MAQGTERLRRYLDDELEECRNEDVERRLDELSTLEAALVTRGDQQPATPSIVDTVSAPSTSSNPG